MNIKGQLRKLRKEKSMTQEKIADMIHVSRQTISNWENGKSYPDIESLILLSDIYKVSLDELVRGDVDIMKKEISKNQLIKYSKLMMFFGVISMLFFIALSRTTGSLKGVIVAITSVMATIFLIFSLKIEKIKKNENIQTYNEILNYLNENESDKNRD